MQPAVPVTVNRRARAPTSPPARARRGAARAGGRAWYAEAARRSSHGAPCPWLLQPDPPAAGCSGAAAAHMGEAAPPAHPPPAGCTQGSSKHTQQGRRQVLASSRPAAGCALAAPAGRGTCPEAVGVKVREVWRGAQGGSAGQLHGSCALGAREAAAGRGCSGRCGRSVKAAGSRSIPVTAAAAIPGGRLRLLLRRRVLLLLQEGCCRGVQACSQCSAVQPASREPAHTEEGSAAGEGQGGGGEGRAHTSCGNRADPPCQL